MRGLDGRVALVTGGGGGIGAATSARLAEEGARVALLDIDAKAASAATDRIAQAGGAARGIAADITDREAVSAAITETEEAFGPVDLLVNNAGWDLFRPFAESDPAYWDKLIAINLVGALNVTHAVLQGMAARKFGRIVTVASDAGRVGSSGEAVYAACKGGLIAFSKTLAREHARDGICVNTICPGPTETALLEGFFAEAGDPEKLANAFRRAVPMGRLGRPDDLPGAIAFLLSDDAAFITGQVLSVSGGLTMNG